MNEFSLYSIQQEIETKFSNLNLKIIPKLISILDKNNLEKIFKQYKPNTVFHAAAYKHVKIVEDNPFAGIENNVFGTLILAKLSLKYKVSNFLLISTDKAVRSSNIMGASKRLAELIAQAFEKKVGITKFSMVRFGNVLGSSGSVVPKFMEQIKSGGPITLTHEKVTNHMIEGISLKKVNGIRNFKELYCSSLVVLICSKFIKLCKVNIKPFFQLFHKLNR